MRSESSLAKASTGHQGLITSGQNERGWASVELVGQEATYVLDTEGYEDTRRDRRCHRGLRGRAGGRGAGPFDAFQPAVEALSGLETVRQHRRVRRTEDPLTNIERRTRSTRYWS